MGSFVVFLVGMSVDKMGPSAHVVEHLPQGSGSLGEVDHQQHRVRPPLSFAGYWVPCAEGEVLRSSVARATLTTSAALSAFVTERLLTGRRACFLVSPAFCSSFSLEVFVR